MQVARRRFCWYRLRRCFGGGARSNRLQSRIFDLWGNAMKMSKLGYFSEFLLFPPLVLVGRRYSRFAVSTPPIGFDLGGWSTAPDWWPGPCWNIVLHRVLFHHAPVLSGIHDRHHQAPQDLIGTPAWASVVQSVWSRFATPGLGGASDLIFGTAATAGLVTGYLWYVFVHYATHHWQPRREFLSLPGSLAPRPPPPLVRIAEISA